MGVASGQGYVADFVVRKFVLVRLCVVLAGESSQQFWDARSAQDLQALCADANEHLSCLPASWTASEAFALICDRRDWPMLASTVACLWSEVAKACPDAVDAPRFIEVRLSELVACEEHARERFCHALHPTVLARSAALCLGHSNGGMPQKRAAEHSHASTPAAMRRKRSGTAAAG